MKNLFCSKIISSILLFGLTTASGQNELPKLFSRDSQKIFSLRQAYQKGELKNNETKKYLIRQADKLLSMEPLSVMDKELSPPSGNKHDYMSMGKYWWPNPETKDGLPYIRKDGEVNPEALKISDAANCGKMISAVEILSNAFYITNDSKYSEKATQLLRTWFIDEKSLMNPHLDYAQFIPGKSEGRGVGIIDTHNFYRLIDALGLLENSNEWTDTDKTKIRKWFDEYLLWLQTSKNGMDESKARNNHGSWYDVQVVSILLFSSKKEKAKDYIESVTKKRIASQVQEDGKQPEELARTNGMSYTLFNLKAHFLLAVFGDLLEVDLWNYKDANGGTIRQALDYLLPFVLEEDKWEYDQISSFKTNDVYPLLVIAQKKYDDKIYSEWIKKIFGDKLRVSLDRLYE